ncbi:MAG: 2,3-bisphosphoglycerate-independent phosphoglycerate mutase [Candidatus Dojkabacteria bacterium]
MINQLRKKIMLIVLDGLGAAPNTAGNAVTLARPTTLMKYWDSYPHTYLEASGEAVGLPQGIYGNSEVGHMNIGAGKVVFQNLPKINKSIVQGHFYNNETLTSALAHAVKNQSAIHVMGLTSDGGVHSDISHFLATLQFFAKHGYKGKLYFHAFTDGRDTPPKSAQEYLNLLQAEIERLGIGHIGTMIGRAFAMDRNHKWERTQKAYELLVNGRGKTATSWKEGLLKAYEVEQVDEYIEPIIIPNGTDLPIIKNNDSVIFLNFRSDRAIQLTDTLITQGFNSFPVKQPQNLFYAGMVEYLKDFPKNVLFPKEYLKLSLGRILAERDMRQLRIAESEKFPHVTYFFNGGLAIKYNGEDRIEIKSPNVPTYDLKPEMSCMEVTAALLDRIRLNIYDFIVLNVANTDMVGHTGNLQACIKAVQTADYVISKVVPAFLAIGGTVIITADHGNIEEVLKPDTGDIDTEHSLNPVPFIIVDKTLPKNNLKYGKLSDIAPTILKLMSIDQPSEMSGHSLI